MRPTARLIGARAVLLGVALAWPWAVPASGGPPVSPNTGYAGCYRVAFTSWPRSGRHKPPYVPPSDIELSRTTATVGSHPSRVIPLVDPKHNPQFTYWKEGDAGDLVIVWGTRLSSLTIVFRRSDDGVLRGKAEILYDDGGRHQSEATATPTDCGNVR